MSEESQPKVQETAAGDALDSKEHRTGEKLVVPVGMSRRAYKRQLRAEKIAKERPEWTAKRAEKRRQLRAERKARLREEAPTEISESVPPKRPRNTGTQTSTGVIIDCGFDEMMKDGERTSLARQIVRSYSENRRAPLQMGLTISSFNSKLKELFDNNMRGQWHQWTNVEFAECDLAELPEVAQSKRLVYLSSDSDDTLQTLDENTTYVVGGIVDKGRYKDLCKSKAERLGIPTARLPIDEHVRISGRRVLTTNHVVELMLKWLELRDWKAAFEAVLPDRKLPTLRSPSRDAAGETPQAADAEVGAEAARAAEDAASE